MTPQPSKRLKGKARQEAKARVQSSAGAFREQKLVVRVCNFVPMAEYIAKKDFEIPVGLVGLVKRCIRARMGTADWFGKSDMVDKVTSERNENHKHFIAVLQETLQILLRIDRPKDLRQLRKTKKLPVSDAEFEEEFVNRFNVLNVEDIDDAEINALPTAVPITSADNNIRYELEPQDDEVEWLFAIDSFYNDMHELRRFLGTIWARYREGELDLGLVAVTTNIALDLVRAEDEFEDETPLPKFIAKADTKETAADSNYYYDYLCAQMCSEIPFNDILGENLTRHERWRFALESFHLPRDTLKCLWDTYRTDKNIIAFRPDLMSSYIYDLKADRSKMAPRELYESDIALTMDFMIVRGPSSTVRDVHSSSNDEFTVGFWLLMHENDAKIRTWLVFATQVYLDIHHILQDQAEKPFQDWYDYSARTFAILSEHYPFDVDWKLQQRRDFPSEKIIKETRSGIKEWILEDKMLKLIRKGLGEFRRSCPPVENPSLWKPYELYKMHPLLCGTCMYGYQLTMDFLGVKLFNMIQINVATHLYNALKQHKILPEEVS